MARYYSPPGTFEAIRKSVLEDPSLTDAEFRLALYLVTKEPGWVIHPGQIAAALGRTPNWIKTNLPALRRRGWVYDDWLPSPDGRPPKRLTRFRRDLLVHKTPGRAHDAEIPHDGADQPKQQEIPGRAHDAGFPVDGETRAISEYGQNPYSENEKSRPPVGFAAAAAKDEDLSSYAGAQRAEHGNSQDPRRHQAEVIVCGFLAEWFGCFPLQIEPDEATYGEFADGVADYERAQFGVVTGWQQRTFKSHLHKDTAAFTRYMVRCYRAAPDLMKGLATAKYDDGSDFTDFAGEWLSDLRALVRDCQLTEADQAWCQTFADQAADAAAEPYATLTDAAVAGALMARQARQRA